MPVKNIDFTMAYDFAGWRTRLGTNGKPIEKKDAATTVGVSYATWNRAETAGAAQKTLVWACYGVEQAARIQRETAAAAEKAAVKVPGFGQFKGDAA